MICYLFNSSYLSPRVRETVSHAVHLFYTTLVGSWEKQHLPLGMHDQTCTDMPTEQRHAPSSLNIWLAGKANKSCRRRRKVGMYIVRHTIMKDMRPCHLLETARSKNFNDVVQAQSRYYRKYSRRVLLLASGGVPHFYMIFKKTKYSACSVIDFYIGYDQWWIDKKQGSRSSISNRRETG